MGNPSYVAYAELQMEEIKKRKVNFPVTDEEVAKVIEQLKPFDLSLNQDKLCEPTASFLAWCQRSGCTLSTCISFL